MATLPLADLKDLQRDYCSDVSSRREGLTPTRADLAAAVAAIDSWADSNVVSFNAAIPQPARGLLTGKQKAELLMRVLRRRWEVA